MSKFTDLSRKYFPDSKVSCVETDGLCGSIPLWHVCNFIIALFYRKYAGKYEKINNYTPCNYRFLPYSLKWDAKSEYLDDPRYSGVGKLAPKSHADFAFLQHMVYHMDENDGRIAVLLPHGVLFRGGAEEEIRKFLIRDLNRLDAVIGLPANLFHGASIPVVVLVLKSKRNGNSGNILFIDASREYKPGKVQNELTDENIQKIVETYLNRADVEKYAHVAPMSEIEENGYNLNIPRYVDTSEKEEEIDIAQIKAELAEIQAKKQAAMDKVSAALKMLGL